MLKKTIKMLVAKMLGIHKNIEGIKACDKKILYLRAERAGYLRGYEMDFDYMNLRWPYTDELKVSILETLVKTGQEIRFYGK